MHKASLRQHQSSKVQLYRTQCSQSEPCKVSLMMIQAPTTTAPTHKLTCQHHSQASQDKFRSLYRISDVVPFDDAVINLVTVAQTALFLFHLLKKEYIDGLLCNETMKAFGNFYREYHPAEIQEVIELLLSCISRLLLLILRCEFRSANLGWNRTCSQR